ncbi:MAG: putative portal protein [Prokaryotic dsDNA virus sp.]|nr:MAG: putative portal protein [Prokaryotic dsDNA virus sp.]|tara:strand:- start:16620 stop:18026 length:1407 start_codon:yes stop_codon:yes gene_type:complete
MTQDTVAKRSPASAAMMEGSAKGRALMGGTKAMREAGEAYLPKFEAESDKGYKARLHQSWLFNGYRKTVRDMNGRVFEKPVEIVEGSSADLDTWLENVDMQGRDFSTFASEVFKDGLSGPGVSYIMVDAPRRDGDTSRQDAKDRNLRPFMVHLKVEEVLGWKAETINNVMTLTQIRIAETVTETDPDDEFSEVTVKQVRVLDLIEGRVSVRIFQSSNDKWSLVDEYPTDMTEIMVVPFYANRSGYFTGEPLLDDLSDINIAHWQSQSDQRNILHFARTPILFTSGYDDDGGKSPLVISAGMATTTHSEQADMKWVEHSGAAIGAGRQDLKDLEFQMETFGLQLLVARDGAQSATGEALDAAKETTQLAMIADSLQDALERAVAWMYQLAGINDASVSLRVNKDYGVSMMTAQEVTVMLTAVNTGNMSRETFLGEMSRRGMVRADLDIDKEQDRIEAEAPELLDDGGDE